MKRTLRNIFKATVFLLILFIILIYLSYLFTPKNNTKESGMDSAATNAILAEKENTIDVLFIGDSIVYSGIIPMQIWEEQGFTSYDYATSGQYLSYTVNSLKTAFKTQSPKLVVLDANSIYRKIKPDTDMTYKIQSLMSVFKYHDRWKNLHLGDFYSRINYTWTNDFKGYVYRNDCTPAPQKNYMKQSQEVREIESLNMKYVEEIRDICKENGSELLLISVPSLKLWSSAKHNGVAGLAEKLELNYLDMNLLNDEIKIDWQTDSRDQGDHLNYYGATKLTSYLGSYLKEKYDLPDRRSDKNYDAWNQALVRFKNRL